MLQKKHSKRSKGKIAVITGATGGIGKAIAKRLLEEGAGAMLLGRSEAQLKNQRTTCQF